MCLLILCNNRIELDISTYLFLKNNKKIELMFEEYIRFYIDIVFDLYFISIAMLILYRDTIVLKVTPWE